MNKPVIIGIAGGTASGKTTLAKKLKEKFEDDVILLSHDFYYKSYTHMTMEERLQSNYDCPDAFETDYLIKQLKELQEGKGIQQPIYSYVTRLREKETVTVEPKKVIIVEGILILENKELVDMFDLKVFVDTDADIRLLRLIKRDIKERGLDIEYISEKYKSTLKPMHEQYVEPSKKNSDIIVPNGGKNQAVVDLISEKIKNIL